MLQAFERILEHSIQLNFAIKTVFIRDEKPIFSLPKSFVNRETKQRNVKMKEIISAHRFSDLNQFKKSLKKAIRMTLKAFSSN